ncbi:MAG: DEAD/DEAH box helicase [Candidatus Bathyarchaeia archaeon]
MPEFVDHPMIKAGVVERRPYQDRIVETCSKGNTLVTIPTGLGKTVIAARVAAERLYRHPGGRCFILAPTRPLILQHAKTFRSLLELRDEDFCIFTGETPPGKRAGSTGRLVFMTPQILENDILAGRVSLRDVVLLVFDEAHRAVGNYAYVFIAEQYLKTSEHPLIMGLTASPGSSREKIEEIRRNLGIQFIEARSEMSPDVRGYVAPLEVEWCSTELPPAFKSVKSHLESFIRERSKALREAGFLETGTSGKFTFESFKKAMRGIQSEIAKYSTPPQHLRLLLSDLLALRRCSYAVELLETQGLAPLKSYFAKLEAMGSRSGVSTAVRSILMDGEIRDAINLTLLYEAKGVEHPKLEKLVEKVRENLSKGARRIIVFTNYRETASRLIERLGAVSGVKAVRFVGQSSKLGDEGLSQKEQVALLDGFRRGVYNVLVATQVAEEGIDISASDLVIFYDNVPSAIRFIQRRGRTARGSPGRLIILVTKDTRDEAYYWLAKRKEKLMLDIIREMQPPRSSSDRDDQPKLEPYLKPELPRGEGRGEGPLIYVDNRDSSSQVVKELIRLGARIELKNLPVGDYVLSEDVAVERKTSSDLADSIIDKRLFTQAKELSSSYTKPIFIVEGEDPYTSRGISAQAIRGAILSLMLDFRIPVLITKNPTETALMLIAAAKSEQLEKKEVHISVRAAKKPLTLTEQQEYIVAGLPNVERTLARRLLSALGSVEGVFTATKEELQRIHGVGDVIAEKIRRVITAKYQTDRVEGQEE